MSDLEKPEEEVAAEVKPVDPIEEKKKELLREMSTIGMGQVNMFNVKTLIDRTFFV